LRVLDGCLKDGPADADAFRARGALRTRLGQYAGAQADYTRALEVAPDAATHAARGWCCLVADAPRLALEDFEAALRLAPDLADACAGRGFARAVLGSPRAAVADAEEALRRGPRSPRLYYNVARVFARAAAGPDGDLPRDGSADFQRQRWLGRAVANLTQALDHQSPAEAARFWHNVIDTDPVLNPLRRQQGFWDLAARYPRQQAQAGPARPAAGP
jgi:tetratricopeptide (TPR) repeat protein